MDRSCLLDDPADEAGIRCLSCARKEALDQPIVDEILSIVHVPVDLIASHDGVLLLDERFAPLSAQDALAPADAVLPRSYKEHDERGQEIERLCLQPPCPRPLYDKRVAVRLEKHRHDHVEDNHK